MALGRRTVRPDVAAEDRTPAPTHQEPRGAGAARAASAVRQRRLPLPAVAPDRGAAAATPPIEAAASTWTPLEVQRLHSTLGNAGVARLLAEGATGATRRPLQRAPLTPTEDEKNLESPQYAGDPVLEKAFDENPPLERGARGEAVAKVQQGFIDDGIAMPKSVKKSGKTDGIFGPETFAVARVFQGKHGLEITGRIGRETLGKLDEIAGAPPEPEKPALPPEIAANQKEMGAKVAAGMKQANVGHSPTSGIWYDFNYHSKHLRDPGTYPWDDDWRSGLAAPEYFDRVGYMDWRLKPGKSASAGIQAWIRGLTIAECTSAIVAIEIDTVRAAIGDTKFDDKFGSPGKALPDEQRLRVHQGTSGTPAGGMFIDRPETGSFGKRDIKVGDWVYFYNHPKYLLKHPGGAFQGENAVYTGDNPAGEQLFEGLGVTGRTEQAMLEEMAKAYNHSRNGDDYADLLRMFASDTPEVSSPNQQFKDRDLAYLKGLYTKYEDRIDAKYRDGSSEFDDKIDVDRIRNDPEYTIGDTKRKGGFTGPAGLDPAKVEAMRKS
jgi:hypothetical protein